MEQVPLASDRLFMLEARKHVQGAGIRRSTAVKKAGDDGLPTASTSI